MPKSVLFDREQVLNKVTRLFWEKGYNGTSMQDLVDVTGLNRSSLYNSFGDKFQLFTEALKNYQANQNKQLQSVVKNKKSPKAALRSLFENIKESLINSENNRGCFLTNCTSELSYDPKIRSFLADNKDRVTALFEEMIIKAQEAGEIDKEKDAKSIALYLFSNLQGLRVTSMVLSKPSEIEPVTDHIFNSL